jgi:hypothetical protein
MPGAGPGRRARPAPRPAAPPALRGRAPGPPVRRRWGAGVRGQTAAAAPAYRWARRPTGQLAGAGSVPLRLVSPAGGAPYGGRRPMGPPAGPKHRPASHGPVLGAPVSGGPWAPATPRTRAQIRATPPSPSPVGHSAAPSGGAAFTWTTLILLLLVAPPRICVPGVRRRTPTRRRALSMWGGSFTVRAPTPFGPFYLGRGSRPQAFWYVLVFKSGVGISIGILLFALEPPLPKLRRFPPLLGGTPAPPSLRPPPLLLLPPLPKRAKCHPVHMPTGATL